VRREEGRPGHEDRVMGRLTAAGNTDERCDERKGGRDMRTGSWGG
jgi:hypothetical protein